MSRLQHVPVEAMDPHRFESGAHAGAYARPARPDRSRRPRLAGPRDLERQLDRQGRRRRRAAATAARLLARRRRRRALGGDRAATPEFFELTKRLHNHLHGFDGDGGALGDAEHAGSTSGRSPRTPPSSSQLVRAGDIVILHDPQTAGLVAAVESTGATVIWRCHVGLDEPNDAARARRGSFLRAYVLGADAYVFSRAAFAWEGLDRERIAVIQPSIDAFSPKNQDQTASRRSRSSRAPGSSATSARRPGDVHARRRHARAGSTAAPRCSRSRRSRRDDRVVTQVSRWDRLKDPLGVMHGLRRARRCRRLDAHLVLAGPVDRVGRRRPRGRGGVRAGARGVGRRCRTPCARASTSPRCRWTTSRRTPRSSTRSSATPTSSCRRAWPRASG